MRLLGAQWTKGTIIRRYKRFLADVVLANGQEIIAHCPNTGAMTNCWAEGDTVFLSSTNDPRRKTQHTLEIIRHRGRFIGINSAKANDLIFDALKKGRLERFSGFEQIERESAFLDSRFDFKLTASSQVSQFIEVKSVTYHSSNGWGLFPDAPSVRARKHLQTLIEAQQLGFKAALVFCVQHSGIKQIAPASAVDPEYAELLGEAVQAGVSVCGVGVAFRPPFAWVSGSLPVALEMAVGC
ncbi:MAG: DNA/RNA nuclease SfsA [Pseudomonadales bacterium]